MAGLFETFLARHRTTLETALIPVVRETDPTLTPTTAHTITRVSLDRIYDLVLGNLSPLDADFQAGIVAMRSRGLTAQIIHARTVVFEQVLMECARTDTSLTDSQQQHILRLIAQSVRFLTAIEGALR